MHYAGFVIMYTFGKNHPDQSTHFVGPFNDYAVVEQKYEELRTLTPSVDNIQIAKLVTNPCNPKLY